MLLVGAICFEASFCASRKSEIGGGGCHTLVDRTLQLLLPWTVPGRPFFLLSCTNRLEKLLISPCRGTISGSVGSFQSRSFLWSETLDYLTIECSLMSGCGQGHELARKEAVTQESINNQKEL